MRIKEITRTSTFAWSSDVIPLLATGSVAGAVDLSFSAASTLEIFDVFGQDQEPIFSATLENKFHALAWSKPFGNYPRGLLVGAFETGIVEFWDAESLIRTRSLDQASVHKSSKHTSAVKCLAFNPLQPHLLVSGGHKGEILIWDAQTFAEPFAPGRPVVPMDEITSVAWNNSVSHILATTSNGGYTSIWDVKAKREVLHLQYNGSLGKADFSQVAWHPSQSTKLITASQSDSCPTIMTWDLRNASEPEAILQGHEKGVLSLDWCNKDAGLLLSSGKDNSTKLWNPLTGEKLGDFPPAVNWTFLARFAPNAPDVIASASFDGKIIIQTLQDTTPKVAEPVQATDENDFWSNISTATASQSPSFVLKQAPQWLKTPCSASFGFGSKLVTVKTVDGKSTISITKTEVSKELNAEKLAQALKNDDFSELIAEKLQANPDDVSDWKILDALAKNGKQHFLRDIVSESNGANEAQEKPKELSGRIDNLDDDDFFSSLANDTKPPGSSSSFTEGFAPSGPFKLSDDSDNEKDAHLRKLLLSNKISEAVDQCLKQGKLLEALVLSLDQSEAIKDKVKASYFAKSNSGPLPRLIYSASSKSVVDLVANADIANWKEIASSIFAYCSDTTDFNSKIVELGDRILESSASQEDRDNALECYLAGEALDKVSAIWLKDLATATKNIAASEDGATPADARFAALSAFIEKLSAYRSLSKIAHPLSGPAIEPTCNAVFEFATMAANSGNFELADQFLALLPENYDGLRAEKERISKATSHGSTKADQSRRKAPQTTAQNGRFGVRSPAKPAFNPLAKNGPHAGVDGASSRYSRPPPAASLNTGPSYGNLQSFTPGSSGLPPARTPVNPYGRGASSYTPAAQAAPSAGAYPPSGSQRMPSTGVIVPPTGPVFGNTSGPAAPRFGSISSNPSAPSPSVPPAQSGFNDKEETDGWNDLPETFKAKTAARRGGTPAAAAVVSPRAPASHIAQPPSAPPTRKSQNAVPTLAPPPPRAASRQASHSGRSSPRLPPTQASRHPSMNDKYAPPPSAISLPPQNGFSAPSSKVATPSAPPKNPYAPSGNSNPAPTKSSFVPPPTSNFASSPMATIPQNSAPPQPSNPYGPPSGAVTQPPTNPYAPSQPSTQAPTNPYAPNSGRGPRGQYSTPASARGSRKPSFSGVPPPPVRSHPANSTPPVGPPPTSAPPQRAAPSSVTQPPQQPPATNAPPRVSAAAAPPTAPSQSGVAPPPAAVTNNIAPPPRRAASAAPPTGSSAPQSTAQPPQSKPVQPAAAPEASQAQNGSSDVTPDSEESIGDIIITFTKYKDLIKPAAPEKYSKHVIDMEKRLNILFNRLRARNVFSRETIVELKEVAAALEKKQWKTASSINLAIPEKHPSEVADWHVGVKRLVTMAEAFDS